MHPVPSLRASRAVAAAVVVAAIALGAGTAQAQTPGEVAELYRVSPTSFAWTPVAGADLYNVYRGTRAGLIAGAPPVCAAHPVPATTWSPPDAPEPGGLFVYLVTASTTDGREGPAGVDGSGVDRPLAGSCARVVEQHVLDRVGYGWRAATRDRVAALGLDGWIDEQLDPSSIDESGNAALNDRLAALEPPADGFDLIGAQVVRAVYSARQLEQRMAMFWANHFNTYNEKVNSVFFGAYPPCFDPPLPQCDPAYPALTLATGAGLQYRDIQTWRTLAFEGTFREMLEANATSPAMIIYLDTLGSVAGAPNENYPRELLELYALGVAGGYTQTDVEELARVFTGWAICRRDPADVGNPLAACQAEYWVGPGDWTAAFDFTQHDCGAKTLFAGTPQEMTIPDTCATPLAGVDDLDLALDAIAGHPATRRFISRKILELLVSDEVEESWVDQLVAVWDDASNPAGVGDMGAVTRAALELAAFRDPLQVRTMVKTPFEHVASGVRALNGRADGQALTPVLLFLLQHTPFYNPVPTGYPERGSAWVDTNNTLQRENFGIYLVASTDPEFGADLAELLVAEGVPTAPGNAEAVVDFLADILFAGRWTPAERQAAIDYLETDDLGNPAPYDLGRVYQVAAFMLGYPHFQEQ